MQLVNRNGANFVRRKKVPRFSLRTFLIVSALSGVLAAAYMLYGQRGPKYLSFHERAALIYGLQVMTSREVLSDRKVVFVLCYLSARNASYRARLTGFPNTAPTTDLPLYLAPEGIFVHGKHLPGSSDGLFWVLDPNSNGEVVFRVDLGPYEGTVMTPESIRSGALYETPMWKERIMPVLAFLDLRNRLMFERFGYEQLSAEYRDRILGPDFGRRQGELLSVENLPSLESVQQLIDEVARDKEDRWRSRMPTRK